MTSCSCESVFKFVLQSLDFLVLKMSKLNGENTGVAGDFGAGSPVDMVSAIHEHISCTKEVDPFGSEDNKDEKIAYPCELDHMYASMAEARTLREESSEMMHYKELLLLHLDLIQQQSEQIAMKDKELSALRQEVETLKQRLQRMDRRVTLQKHREVSDIGPLNCGSPAPGSPASPFGPNILPLSCSDGEVDEDMEVGNDSRSLTQSDVMIDNKPNINLPPNMLQIPQVLVPNNTNTSISPLNSLSLKRKRTENGPCPEPDASVANRRRRRRLASWSSDTPSSGTRRSGVTPLVDGATVPETQDTVEPINRRNRVSGTPILQRSSKSPQIKVNQWESRSSRTRSSAVLVKKDAILVTSDHYYTPVGEEDFHWWNPSEELSKTSTSSEDVEVPSWRIRVCTSCYSMEGTENLGDDVFNKRHMRLEIDERRRKRWDIQRIREQRQYERLRQRESTCVKGGRSQRHSRSQRTSSTGSGVPGEEVDRVEESSDVESFWPDPEDAKFLEISNVVPISAFGVPLVKFEPSVFSTSWVSPRGKAAAPVSNCSRRKYDGGRR